MNPTLRAATAAMTAGFVLSASLYSTVASACRKPPHRPVSIVQRVASMAYSGPTRALASRHGLSVLNVLWEDTGRWQGSSVGPNISDVTIEVEDAATRARALMPVLRAPNFSDKTGDVKLDKFFLKVGNEREGRRLRTITLREFLANPTRYLSLPKAGTIKGGTLLAERDTHALVSAQATFLPVPQSGKATFHPVIFNYQSTKNHPAVLTILVTRQGTSATIVDNARDTVGGGRSWGQRLFFNKNGQRAPLTAERLTDVKASGKTSNGEDAASLGDDANLLMLVQVPLKYPPRPRRMPAFALGGTYKTKSARARRMVAESAPARDDMDTAVLGHGPAEGPFTELANLTIERDPRFPVRVTVQFYQATSTPNLSEASISKLARQISNVYEKADYVGSLVVPSPSDRRRPTNWDGVTPAPAGISFRDFPGLLERYVRYGMLRLPYLFF